MNQLINKSKEFVCGEEGAAAIEYALLAALIAIEIIASGGLLGDSLKNTFGSVAGKLAAIR